MEAGTNQPQMSEHPACLESPPKNEFGTQLEVVEDIDHTDIHNVEQPTPSPNREVHFSEPSLPQDPDAHLIFTTREYGCIPERWA